MIEITAYLCEHCKARRKYKKYLSKGAAKKHEDICIYNPRLKMCQTCKHHCTAEETGFYCMVKKINLDLGEMFCRLWEFDDNFIYGHFMKSKDFEESAVQEEIEDIW